MEKYDTDLISITNKLCIQYPSWRKEKINREAKLIFDSKQENKSNE